MADTPDSGAAWTGAVEAQTAVGIANEALLADPDNADLKTAHETAEQTFTDARGAYDKSLNLSSFPETWREDYVGTLKDSDGNALDEAGQEKKLKMLGRYATPKDAFDAGFSAQKKISQGVKLGEAPTDKELEDYRADNNIPAEAKDYEIELADGVVIGDVDQPLVDSFKDVAHQENIPTETVNAVLNWYFQEQGTILETLQEAQFENDATLKNETDELLRTEFGAGFKAETNRISNYLSSEGEGVSAKVLGARTPDGTLLGSDLDFIKFLSKKAREANPAATLVSGSGETQMNNLNDEIEALEKRISSDPEWHKDKKANDRYMALLDARAKSGK